MTRDHLLAIDCGTQSVRALLFDLQGNLVTKARVPLESYFSTQPGWAEQHPAYFWDALSQACQQLWKETTVPKEAVAAVALASQRGTVVNVDRNGEPLRPAIVWPDRRRTEGLPPVRGLWGVAFQLARTADTVAFIQAEAEANWIRTHQPDIWARTHKYLLLSGYLTYRLTGRFADSVGCQVAYLPFDYKHLRWSGPRDWKWAAIPLDPALLPELVAPTQPLGEISRAASDATGIPAGLPLIAAASDKACEVIGSGCLEPHMACLSFGTNAALNTIQRKYVEAIPLIPPWPAAVPGAYSLELQIYRGFWMVSWFKQEFGEHERRLAQERHVEPEVLFEELVDAVPPGSAGLVLQPYWSPGVKVPGPEARGAIIGFTDVHTRAHVYRAILEGLVYELRAGKERTERRSGIPITELRVAGGGSRSDGALQITADVFNLPATRPHVYEATGLGAAIVAAVGSGLHRDFAAAVREMTHPDRRFEPNPQNVPLYEELFHEVYRPMYARLQPLYETMRNVFGLPGRMG